MNQLRLDGGQDDQEPGLYGFDRFWAAWPPDDPRRPSRKVSKGMAKRLWIQRGLWKVADHVMAALEIDKQTDQWSQQTYRPMVTTWLRGGRWERDDAVAAAKAISLERDMVKQDLYAAALERKKAIESAPTLTPEQKRKIAEQAGVPQRYLTQPVARTEEVPGE